MSDAWKSKNSCIFVKKKCNYSRSSNINENSNHYIPEDHNRKQDTEPVSAVLLLQRYGTVVKVHVSNIFIIIVKITEPVTISTKIVPEFCSIHCESHIGIQQQYWPYAPTDKYTCMTCTEK